MGTMPRPEPFALIDTSSERSVSFAPPDQPVAGVRQVPDGPRAPLAVGTGRTAIPAPAFVGGALRDGVSGYPIQLGKVRRPPLHDETLARHRLLDWLDIKVHSRVVFVIADAGYGKTTLLADFSRRTRLRTLWYRMDKEDRDWVSFVSCLVASGREHDPSFAPRTGAMLDDTGPGGPTREEVMEALIRELPLIAPEPATLIIDDFHVADDVADIKLIARELVEKSPERLSIIFSSRRTPSIPVARLRARGELAELTTADLRFSEVETETLFNETYGRMLERDVVADLSARTEGWVASLYLVQAALRDRNIRESRAFVKGLSGAHAELYDYLAEEVVGDLPHEHQQFLMGTSILQSVDQQRAQIVTGFDSRLVSSLIAGSEKIGLLARRQERKRGGHGYHPLVREFLEARLRREVGDEMLQALHRRVAVWAEPIDWRISCYHYQAAGDLDDLRRALEASIESIVAGGDISLAAEFVARFPTTETSSAFEVIRSRQATSAADVRGAVDHARRAVELDGDSDAATGNLLATYFQAGDLRPANDLAGRLAKSARTPVLRDIAEATRMVLDVTLGGDLNQGIDALTRLAERNRQRGHSHYEGVSLLNTALMRRAQGDAAEVLRDAGDALAAFARGSAGWEALSAELAMAWATAHLGRLGDAREMVLSAGDRCTSASRSEWLVEAADIELAYGDESAARSLINECTATSLNPSVAALSLLTRVHLALRTNDLALAQSLIPEHRPSIPTQEPGHVSRYLSLRAQLAVMAGATDARERVVEAIGFAEMQSARLWSDYCQVLLAVTSDDVDSGLRRIARQGSVYLSIAAEVVIRELHRLDDASVTLIANEADNRPDRWRDSIRRAAVDDRSPNRAQAARILDRIGGPEDIPLLRSVARGSRKSRFDSALGRGLARRLAAKVTVEDQGRVEIHVGPAIIPGTSLRRKVLAMLCFLLTRTRFSATRDEIVDALWPEMAPDVAINSLNQTVYFLRRVFEPSYSEDLSAGYVHHNSDVLWLDPDLIHSRSRACHDLIDKLGPSPSPEDVDSLSQLYVDRFALDFSYEDWAVPYRDALHVAYLQVIEAAVNRDLETGHHDRGIRLARRALAIDPDLESLELSLLRLYRVTGAHSAAAEQYSHYATYLREELGVEPPPLSSL
jgi:ATP/maltotriose-dependent transcriptional regulator MalT/DNA-binding SARP family transcriptional activator